MICPRCGAQSEPGSEFCDQCGTPLIGKEGKKKRSRLPLVLIMLFLILAAAGAVTVWIVTDEHHTIAEAEESYHSAIEALAAEESRAVREETEQAEEDKDSSGEKEEGTGKEEDRKAESSAEAKDKEDTERVGDEYIIPDSDSRYLTDADIEGLSLQEINYAKNEIYARRGRRFDSQELQNYFNSKSWYVGRYDPSDFDQNYAGTLNDYEKKNAEFLSEKEFSISPDGYKLDAN